MTLSIVPRLALKDLYLTRWIVLGSTLAGAVSLAIAPLSDTMFYVASISYICVLVVLNIFLVMSTVVQEKKDKVQLFVLSLPVSTSQYTVAKIAASVVAFGGPWLILTLASLVMIDITAVPNGLIPAQLAMSVYLLLYYCVLLAVALVANSFGAITGAIIAGNISINFAIPLIFQLPSVVASKNGPLAVWGGDIVTVILAQLAGCALALVIAFVLQSRRKDFV